MRHGPRSLAPALAAVVTAAALAGCSGAGGTPDAVATSPTGSAVAATVRWWPANAGYCTVLRRTVAHGASAVRAAGGLPVVTGSTRAFVSAVQHTAPGAVAPAWRTIGAALLDLVDGTPAPAGVTPDAVRRAERIVAADARSRCSVTLGARQ